MTSLRAVAFAAAGVLVAGCGGSSNNPADMTMAPPDMAPLPACSADSCTTQSSIKHIVVVVQENHTFDTYFGRYCTAPTGSNPTCNTGPSCCEAGPATEPGGASPIDLTDADNSGQFNDRNHTHDCEVAEIDGGKMDKYVTGIGVVGGSACSNPENFAYAPTTLVQPYLDLAGANALADRYFQPYAGQSLSNDVYFATAKFLFKDNAYTPDAIGKACPGLGGTSATMTFPSPNLADLLVQRGVGWAFYAQGYKAMKDANPTMSSQCPPAPADCAAMINATPCDYDPGDNPFNFFASTVDVNMRDYDAQFGADLAAGNLPSVSFVKAVGYKTEHPALGTTISAGVAFVKDVVDKVAASPAASSTLVLFTYDEGGGFFDHVAPPPTPSVDNQPYGTRVPTLAIGTFAKKNYVSHVTMEHSSVVKFIEWNWLGGMTGQLMARDAVVNNIGDLLDPAQTGTTVPAN